MSPFRALFLGLSKLPPIVMLIIILGLATAVTSLYMGQVEKRDRQIGAGHGDASINPSRDAERR